MSLFSSIRMAANAMRASEIGLQVTGQNISNANTPGYIREQAVFLPEAGQRVGGLILGSGVRVDSIIQKIDNYLEERLRGAVGDSANTETLESNYKELEGVIGGLSDNNTSQLMTNFFASISDVLNQPENVSARNMAVLQGGRLAENINYLSNQINTMRDQINDRVVGMATDINRLVEQIRTLNIRIQNTEGGNISHSDAVGLRDQRQQALTDLAKLVDIRVAEQPSGAVTVYSGSTYLVSEGFGRQVEAVLQTDRGQEMASIHLVDSDTLLDASSGELAGLMKMRDDVMGGLTDQLNDFARTLAFEFNKVYSSGQGLSGFKSVTSEFGVDNVDAALNAAGLPYTPANGSFQIMVHNTKTGLTKTTDIQVNLSGTGKQATLQDIVDQLSQVDGLNVSLTSDRRLSIAPVSSDDEIAFGDDSSGLLAALGINTFFSGSTAQNLGVSAALRADPSKFAASRGGVGVDTENAVALAGFADRPLEMAGNTSITVMYDRIVSGLTQDSAIASSFAESARTFQATLEGQKTSTSGVNIDEEAVNMIAFQRAFQASAKYVATLNDLMEILVNL